MLMVYILFFCLNANRREDNILSFRMTPQEKEDSNFPEVFEQRAKQERLIGHSCIKGIFLDELEPDRGNMNMEVMEDCTISCQLLTM